MASIWPLLTWVTASPVVKDTVKNGFRDYVVASFDTAAELQATSTAGTRYASVAGLLYKYDSADATSADNGFTILVSADGNRYKIVAAVREKLTANRTYYVRTDGNDNNSGLVDSAAGAFLTIQKAVNTIADKLDLNSFAVTVQVRDGTYAANVTLRPFYGYGTATVQGNNATPANVVIGTSGGSGFEGVGAMRWTVKDCKIASGVLRGLSAEDGAVILFQNIIFAGATSAILRATTGGQVRALGNFNVEGGASFLWVCGPLGQIDTTSRTITFANSPAFSVSTAYGDTLSYLALFSMTFTNGGTVTGKRYTVNNNAVANTNGGGASYVPGNSAGSTANGGQYI